MNYFLQVIWNYINDKTKLLNVSISIIEICGDAVNIGPPERQLVWWPPFFLFFFLKGKMIVHEIKTKL